MNPIVTVIVDTPKYLFDNGVLQEKQKGRNKLVPRLLGVTKDSVLRLDEKTKEILKTWPLTTVRRWAASPNVFTLDFGDYQVYFHVNIICTFDSSPILF